MNTKAQDIDWDEAPEGYPLWIVGKDGEGEWHREMHDRYMDRQDCYWLKESEGRTYEVYRKPDIIWTGEGLPPVGTVCEALNGLNEEWRKVKILDHQGTVPTAACRDETDLLWWSQCFRPIRTTEEIEAEERKAAIEVLAGELGGHWCEEAKAPHRAMAAYLYDSGYRKTQTVDKV